jgi:hypothetical protein
MASLVVCCQCAVCCGAHHTRTEQSIAQKLEIALSERWVGYNSTYLVVVKLWGVVGCSGEECTIFRVGVILQCPRVGKVEVK